MLEKPEGPGEDESDSGTPDHEQEDAIHQDSETEQPPEDKFAPVRPITHDSNGDPINFLTYDYEADKRWKELRPAGNSYEDAVFAVRVDSYKTAKEIGRYQLTSDQEFEIAKVIAKGHGAVFTELIHYFTRLDELQRFKTGLIAASNNYWGNVKFDVDAFRLEEPRYHKALIRAAVRRSDYQIQFLGDWGLERPDIYENFKVAARRHGLHIMPHLHILGDVSQAEMKELLFEAPKGRLGYHLPSDFKASWLVAADDRFDLAMELADRWDISSKLPNFTLPPDDPRYSDLVNKLFERPENGALRYSQHLNLSDAELLAAFFRLRDRDCQARPNEPGTAYFFSTVTHNPIDMIENIGGFHLPSFERQGAPELFKCSFRVQFADGTIYDSAAEDLFREPEPQQVDDLLQFADQHPDLLPRNWVETAFDMYQHRMLAVEIIRKCYFQSEPGSLVNPEHPLEIAFREVGLDPESVDFNNYDQRVGFNLCAELLSLSHAFPLPAFKSLEIDPEFLTAENAPRFTKFCRDIRMRLHWESNECDCYEWDSWLRLKSKLKFEQVGFSLATLNALTDLLSERPERKDDEALPDVAA